MNEWVIVGIVALIVFLFGAKKLPDLARSLGKSSSEFKKGMSDGASGAEIQVPMFVEEGERVKVDTRSGAYMERVK